MKIVLLVLTVFMSPLLHAKDGSPNQADYVVPAPSELDSYSHFKIKVNKAYSGVTTDTLSYTFPKELTGNPPLTVELKRIPGTENDWMSPEMTALCSAENQMFSCEMHLNKIVPPATMMDLQSVFTGNIATKSNAASAGLVPFIDKNNVIDFLSQKALSPQDLQNKLDVLDLFLSSEPAGILSYPFSDYTQ
jgi:hypothetical protein